MGIDPHSSAPIYQQVADQVRRAVAAGVYRPGEAIPSLRALAVELTVNPNTVQRAFEALEREGLIQSRKGLGMFVTENGAVSARSHSEAALHATFAEGIRSAQAARIPPERIRCAFDKAWTDTHAEVRDEP
jgi:GntR family transcriptional regulator